ncbi:MAG: DUF3488 and transglutaminase-like domain-containing protein [Planctomycetota bacterium]|nr:DUF3488 and transglutaminase-like domain-containing protein [Planctomycetota bacterium]
MSAVVADGPRRGMLARRVQVGVLAVVLLSLLTFGMAEGDALVTSGLIIGALAGWCFTELGPARRGLPRWAATIILFGVLVGAVVRSIEGAPPVSAFSTFLGAIIVLKLWEQREAQDYGQLLTLSVFLVIGAVLTATTLWVGVAIGVLTPLLAFAVMAYQVYVAQVRAIRSSGQERDPQGVPWRPLRPGIVGLIAFMVVGGYLIAGGVFVIVPRGVGFQQFAAISTTTTGRQTGFTDRVDIGRGGLISESQATVMEVRIRSDSAASERPAFAPRYFRGRVLDEYQAGVWSASIAQDVTRIERREPGQRLRLRSDRRVTGIVLQEFRPRGTVARTPVFMLNRPVSAQVTSREQGEVEFTVDDRWKVVSLRTAATPVLRYHVRSLPETQEVPDDDWARRAVTPPPPGVIELARDILREAAIEADPAKRPVQDDVMVARVFEQYLRLNFEYSLDTPAPPLRAEATEHFLRTTRRGHCEHFASALALLCRAAGIEANVIAGYMTSEVDPETGAYVVRQAHAHAWVEVRAGFDVWRTFDGTPTAEVQRLTNQGGVLSRLDRWLDAVENTWNSRIATFDHAAQSRLLGRRTRPGEPWSAGWIEDLRRRVQGDGGDSGEARPSLVRRVGLPALGAAVVVGVFLAVRGALRRAGRNRRTPYAGLDPGAARLVSQVERAFARRMPREPGATLLDWGRQARAPAEELFAVQLVYAWVFAGRPPAPDDLRRAMATLRAGSRP